MVIKQSERDNAGVAFMLQGTASDVGKSVVTTALCRILKQDGYRVAPFKSQNMALNSYVTPDGNEIGRAQGVQAEACGIAATTDMNPVLIKPTHDMHSQIVVHGKPFKHMSAMNYREQFLPEARQLVTDAVDRLKQQYDVVVMEGAGSPAEINLKHKDIVNMNMARWADAPVILVADIDRGGVFAAIVGTLELLEPDERDRVKGFIINKFRGDVALLQPGLDWLEERTGKPVLGVLPYVRNLDIEAEDSVVLDQLKASNEDKPYDLDIAVIRYPRISNFTDVDPLIAEADVRVRFVERVEELGQPDAIVLPGTKSTLEDLRHLRESGLATAISKRIEAGKTRLVGICGGYQMLGQRILDPAGAEAEAGTIADGLGYLPLQTTFYADKKTERVTGRVASVIEEVVLTEECQTSKLPCSGTWSRFSELPIEGYEIHMGRSILMHNTDSATSQHSTEADQLQLGAVGPLFNLQGEGESFGDGYASIDGLVWGTYLHGIFHNDHFRREWLNQLRELRGLAPLPLELHFRTHREEAYDRLATTVREHLKLDLIYDMLGLNNRGKHTE